MPERKGFWKKLEQSKKLQMLFFVCSMVVLMGVYIPTANIVKNTQEKQNFREMRVATETEILYNVDSLNQEEEKLAFSGWIFRLNSKNSAVHVFLKAADDSEVKVIDTELNENKETEKHFVSNWNFGESRFLAEIKEKELKEDICYEVYLVLDYEQKVEMESETVTEKMQSKVFTGKYLLNGELYSYNPQEFYAPQVTDSEVVNVIENGILRAYDLDEKIWIYQLEEELYFIANPDYGSLEENNYKVPVMPYTTKAELLPEHRVQYGFDHLGAYYEDEAYKREGVLPYQVVKVNLSNNYPNTYVMMGTYDATAEKWLRQFKVSVIDWSIKNFIGLGE